MYQTEKKSDYIKTDYRSRNFHGDWVKHFINNYIDATLANSNNNAQKIFAEYKYEHLPKNLYKFYPPTIYSLVNIYNQTLHLSSPRNFNDPFDSYVCIETITYTKIQILKNLKELNLISKEKTENTISENEYFEILNSWSKDCPPPFYLNRPFVPDFLTVFWKIMSSKSQSFKDTFLNLELHASRDCDKKIDYLRNLKFKVTSFSNFINESDLMQNATMWSHYANDHRGFCVKYNMDFNSLEDRELILCGIYPVKYTSQVNSITPRELIKLQFKDNDLIVSKPIQKTLLKALTTKSIFWKYEKEWRLVISSDDSESYYDNTIKFCPIDSIFLGCRIEPELRKHLVGYAEKNKIKIFQTEQSQEKYELNFIEVDSKRLLDSEYYEQLNKINQIKDETQRKKRRSKIERLYHK
jgi:hypothetical protein